MIGFYFRVSSYKQMKDATIETQIGIAKNWIKLHDLEIGTYQFYKDEAISGKTSISSRPGFLALKTDIEAKRIDKVWFYDESRLARADDMEWAEIVSFFRKNKVLMLFNGTEEPVDLNNSDQKMIYTIKNAINVNKREGIVSSSKDGRERVINDGMMPLSHMFGYEHNGRDDKGNWLWKPNNEKLNIVRKMYDDILAGLPVRQAYIKNVPLHILKCGKNELDYWYTRLRRPEYSAQTFDTAGNLIPSKIYTLEVVKPNEYQKMLDILLSNKKKYAKNFKNGHYLGTGIIKCSVCDRPYYNNHSKAKGKYYNYYIHYTQGEHTCPTLRTFPKEKVDLLFTYIYCIEYITRLIGNELSPRFFEQYQRSILDKTVDQIDNLKQIEKQLDNEVDRLKLIIVKDDELKKVFIDDLKVKYKDLSEVRERIAFIESSTNGTGSEIEEFYRNRHSSYLKDFLFSTEETKNYILRKFILSAKVDGKEIFVLTKPMDAYTFFINGIKDSAFEKIAKYIQIVSNAIKDDQDLIALLKEPTITIINELHFSSTKEEIKKVFPDFISIIETARKGKGNVITRFDAN